MHWICDSRTIIILSFLILAIVYGLGILTFCFVMPLMVPGIGSGCSNISLPVIFTLGALMGGLAIVLFLAILAMLCIILMLIIVVVGSCVPERCGCCRYWSVATIPDAQTLTEGARSKNEQALLIINKK